jgi:hypothetical protein
VEPRQRRHVDEERGASLPGPRERVLEDLLRGLGVAGQPVRRPKDRAAVAGEEDLERVEVVGLDPLEQITVARGGGERRIGVRVVGYRPSPIG